NSGIMNLRRAILCGNNNVANYCLLINLLSM
ncbi:MAG: hypothetical protein ACI9IL_000486, partial [Rickettsiales bacterium]